MANPTGSIVHFDRPLTNVSVAYMRQGTWLHDTAFPRVPVTHRSDLYYVHNRGDWLRGDARKRAPATESAGSGYEFGTDTYYADVWAFHKDIADQDRANADPGMNLDSDASRFVTRNIMTTLEREWATTYFQPGVWSLDRAGVASGPTGDQIVQFSEAASDPVGELDLDRQRIKRVTGYEPNVFIAGSNVHRVLKNNADLKDRIKYTQKAQLTAGLIASLLEVDKYLVADSIHNTAVEGADDAIDFIVNPDDALLVYAAPSPSMMEPSGGYTFVWTGMAGSVGGVAVKRIRMEHIESDRIEGQTALDFKQVAADVGIFYDDLVA